ncbi:MAG: hypothetical protein R2806_00205 [Saprospiraceae bacterium]
MKIRIKRQLLCWKIWNENWEMPYPKKTSEKEIDVVVRSLLKIAKEAVPKLSSDKILQLKIEKLFQKIHQLKNDYARGVGT